MPKLLWVALPLLLAAAVLAGLALRRQLPNRHSLNIAVSLLLLAYVGTTAGLGIFWVANQQLPVFDWHYLFGYATVLLLALHLAFNFRIVWRWLKPGRPRVAPGMVAPRRISLGLVGATLASGVAFFLGMRYGRSELQVQWPADAAGGAAGPAAGAGVAGHSAAPTLVERYHDFSSHSRAGLLRRAPSVDWGEPPPPFKTYPGAATLALPPPRGPGSDGSTLAALASTLWHTAGVTDSSTALKLRASPSSGALFSTELYVAANRIDGLPAGLWHYDALAHRLERLGDGVIGAARLGAPDDLALHGAAAVVVATAVFRRSGHKYRDRTYRYVLADLGHAIENLRLAALANGSEARFVMRFDEARAAATLQLDEAEEGVLALLALAPAREAAAAQAAPLPPRWQIAPPPLETSAVLGVTGAIHAATSLRQAAPGAASSAGAPSTPGALVLPAPAAPPAPGTLVLPAPADSGADVLGLIARRRSIRRFSDAPLPLPALSALLAASRGVGVLPLSDTIRVDLVVHRAAGLPAGAYHYRPEDHTLQPRRGPLDLRAASRAAALDQDVIGDAAIVVVLSIGRAALAADPVGPARGYRHAFIEAGRIGERLYLEAVALGLGCCAVGALYDDEASALAGIDPAREWVIHFAAVGTRRSAFA